MQLNKFSFWKEDRNYFLESTVKFKKKKKYIYIHKKQKH